MWSYTPLNVYLKCVVSYDGLGVIDLVSQLDAFVFYKCRNKTQFLPHVWWLLAIYQYELSA